MNDSDLIEIVRHIKTNKAVGLNQRRARYMQYYVNILKPAPLYLYSCIFCSCNIPKKIKTSIVRPICKKARKKYKFILQTCMHTVGDEIIY